jgi:hypothetical protein
MGTTSKVFLILIELFSLGDFHILHCKTIPLRALCHLLLHRVENAFIHTLGQSWNEAADTQSSFRGSFHLADATIAKTLEDKRESGSRPQGFFQAVGAQGSPRQFETGQPIQDHPM